jgi:tetratricopeptide (TPR) repeat protein
LWTGRFFSRVSLYEEKIAASGGAPEDVNKLGVLYARYGKIKEAKAEFEKILAKEEYLPALIDMGNIYFLEQNYFIALDYYERAYEMDESNITAVFCMARIHHQMENYSFVKKYYAILKEMDSELSERFSYLELRQEELSRASGLAAEMEVMIWEEE